MNCRVVVSLQLEGIHHWPECPIEDVSFLKYPHRHLFHIKAWKSVSHTDRDIEIIMLKREIKDNIENYFQGNFESRSCEDIALWLVGQHDLDRCEVLEDGENGAEVWV